MGAVSGKAQPSDVAPLPQGQILAERWKKPDMRAKKSIKKCPSSSWTTKLQIQDKKCRISALTNNKCVWVFTKLGPVNSNPPIGIKIVFSQECFILWTQHLSNIKELLDKKYNKQKVLEWKRKWAHAQLVKGLAYLTPKSGDPRPPVLLPASTSEIDF